mgnify:FL=1
MDDSDSSDSPLLLEGGVVQPEALDIFAGEDYVILAVAQSQSPESGASDADIDSYAAYSPIHITSGGPPEVESWNTRITGKKTDTSFPGFIQVNYNMPLYSL